MALLMKPEPFSSEINRLFNTLFEDGGLQQRWIPPMDLVESDDHFLLRADLPGLGEDDVAIEIRDNTLTISGERKSEYERKERGWYRVERSTGAFSRSLKNGLAPWKTTRSPWAKTNMKKPWSSSLLARTRPLGSRQSCRSTTSDRAA